MLYVSTILIKLISQFKRNDSKYVLKSNRNKVYILMKKHGDKIVQKMIEKHEQIKEYLLVYSATAMNAELTVRSNITRFDTDSDPIGVDNRCSACISHIPEDFVGDLINSNRTIKGFVDSKTSGIKIGTLLWSWQDGAGMEHSFKIPNYYYVPQGKV